MELHSNVYYTHPSIEIMQKLDRLFQEHHGDQDKFIAVAVEWLCCTNLSVKAFLAI